MFEIKSKIEIKILGYFFLNSDAYKYINELAKILNINVANLDKKLKKLEKEGILSSERKGKEKYYFLNKKHPLLKEIKKIYNFKYGLPRILAEKLKDLNGLKEAYIFGSFAKNKIQAESDIDLLLIGTHSSLDAKRLLYKIQDELQREINIIDISPNDLRKRKQNNDEFIKNIFNNKYIKII